MLWYYYVRLTHGELYHLRQHLAHQALFYSDLVLDDQREHARRPLLDPFRFLDAAESYVERTLAMRFAWRAPAVHVPSWPDTERTRREDD